MNLCKFIIPLSVLCVGLIIVHQDAVKEGQNNHAIRSQFEYGLVQSLTQENLIHQKKWSESHEIIHSVLDKWNLHSLFPNITSHHQVIDNFFKDIQACKDQKEFEMHQITLVIHEMYTLYS